MFFNFKKISFFFIFTFFAINCELKKDIKNNDFENLVKSENTFFVMFYMTSCPPCRKTKPIYEKLASEFSNLFVEINVEDSSKNEIFSEYEIRSVPTIICIKNGKIVWKNIGFIDETDLRKNINSLIK